MKKGMLFFVLLLCVVLAPPSGVGAKEYQGEIEGIYLPYLKIGDEDIDVSVNVEVYFKWKAWTLFSEPVEVSQIAFLVSPMALITEKKTGKQYSGIPQELLGKLSFYNVGVLAGPAPHRKEKYPYSVLFDPGASAKTYVGSRESFRKLSKEQKGKYLSFNAPGSPSWDKFISDIAADSSLDAEKTYLNVPAAKLRFQKGLTLDTLEIVRYSVDLTELKAWVLKQRAPTKKQFEAMQAEAKRELSRLEKERDRSLKAKEKQAAVDYMDDFFDTLESEHDPVEQVQVDYEKARRELVAKYEKRWDEQQNRKAWEKLKRDYLRIQAEKEAGLRLVQERQLPRDGDNFTLFREYISGTGYRYGYKHKEKVVMPARFEAAQNFSEGLAFVKIDYKTRGYIDTQGKMVINGSGFADLDSFHDGLAAVSRGDNKWGFINKKGELVVDCDFGEVNSFAEGFAAVKKNGKWGFIDTKGEQVAECKYGYVKSFNEGFAVVALENKHNNDSSCGFINTKGEPIVDLKFSRAESFREGRAAVEKNGRWGFINEKGEQVVDLMYSGAGSFQEGFAQVKKNDGWGFINRDGDLAIGCRFYGALAFKDGLAAVSKKNSRNYVRWGFIDTKGEPVGAIEYIAVDAFQNGTASVVIHNYNEGHCSNRIEYKTTGKINRKGQMVEGPVERSFSNPEFCLQAEKL